MAYVLTPTETETRVAEERSRKTPEPGAPSRHPDRAPGGSFLVGVQRRIRRLARRFRRPLPPKELILFASQMSIMAETGTSLIESLDALQEQATHPRLRRALRSVRSEVKGGQMLSAAMARHGDVFPETVTSLVAVGESGGFLEDMLERISNILGKQAELRSTVRSAFTYPLVLAGFCVLVVTFMMVFILPKFVTIFADMEAALPVPTRLLLGTVHLFATRWMIIVPAVLVLGSGLIVFFGREKGRRLIDRWLLSLPGVGPFMRNVIVSRLMRSVGELLHTGVPLLEALKVSKPLVGNALFRDMIDDVIANITAGKTLSAPLRESGLVPPTVEQMIRTGESSGGLSTTMIKIADFYDERSRVQAKDLTTILEPAMIFLVGGIVAFVVLSLLLPIFKMSSVVH